MPESSTKIAIITQKEVGEQMLYIPCAQFQPTPEDTLVYKWTDSHGELKEMKMPYFCLRDIPRITANIWDYISRAKDSYIELLRGDNLVFGTISAALEFTKTRPVSSLKFISILSVLLLTIYRTP